MPKSAVMWFAYDNGAIEVCDYVCVWFLFNPHGISPRLPPLALLPP